MPPRAVSSTAEPTAGLRNTLRAALAPPMSPAAIRVPPMNIPWVVVMPTVLPAVVKMWAIMRVMVVLPFVPVAAGGEEHVDDGHPHIARRPDCGVGVDRQTRLLVDLDDGPSLIVDRAGNVGGDEVDAGHIQPHHHRRLPGDLD